MININLNKDYGPLKQNFSYTIKNGYNVLVGANNSGKSAIIQFIFQHLVREVQEYGSGKLSIILPERVFVDSTYETSGRQLEVHNTELAQRIYKSPGNYNTYSAPPISELSKLLLTHDNLIKQNNMLNDYLDRLELPELVIGPGQNISFEKISVGFQGSGLRSLLPIVAALTDPQIQVLLIDEPELSLEPKVQKLLRDLLYDVAQKKTIIVTTHSHLFLNRVNVDFNSMVWKDGAVTRIKELNTNSELYELTFKLLGNSLSDLFFPENFIIVEGVSDQIMANKILDLKQIDKSKIKVVSSTGIEKINKIKEAIINTLMPLVINDSPYKKRVVVLIDQRNEQNREKVEEIEKELGDRMYELTVPSLEEYLPEALYLKAGRDKAADQTSLASAKNYQDSVVIKREISDSIAAILEISDLDSIPIISSCIDKAII